MNGIDISKHAMLAYCSEIDEICQPLNKIGITYFNFVRLFKSGGRLLLTNRPLWLEHFYKEALYKDKVVVDMETLAYGDFFLWNSLEDDFSFQVAKNEFNIANGITITYPEEKYIDLYYVGSTRNNIKIINFYIHNVDLFHKFILFFQDKANDIVNTINQRKIFLPGEKKARDFLNTENQNDEKLRRKFNSSLNIKKLYIKNMKGVSIDYLTAREVDCAFYLLQGKTAKETARSLNLSPRTVEDYIGGVKQKLNCNTKHELSKILIKTKIADKIYLIHEN